MKTKAYLTGGLDIKDQLKADGWKWDAEKKAWTETFEGEMTPAEVEQYVRSLPRVRNRGDFQITVQVQDSSPKPAEAPAPAPDPPAKPTLFTRPVSKGEEFTAWSSDRYAAREVGDVINRKDGHYLVTAAEMPTYVPEDAMSFGAPGGMENGWVQNYTAMKLPPLPDKQYPVDKHGVFVGLYAQADRGQPMGLNNGQDVRKEATDRLGRYIDEYSFPGRPGSYAPTNRVRIYENGIVAVQPVYDDAPRETAIFDKDLAAQAKAALDGPNGESPDAAKARDLQEQANAWLKELGIKLPEKTIGTRLREKAAARRTSSS